MISIIGKKEITLREDNNGKCISVGMLYNLRPKEKDLEECAVIWFERVWYIWVSEIMLVKWV